MSEPLSPFAPDRALRAHLTRPAASTRLWLLTYHQNSGASQAVYQQVTGLKPVFWPHVLIRKTHDRTGKSAGRVAPRFSSDRFEILATVRSDKLKEGETFRALLEELHLAIQRDLASFAPTNTTTGRVARPTYLDHAIERDYPMDGAKTVTVYELGVEVRFLSS